MRRWGLRACLVLAALWIARAQPGDAVPVFLGYLLWGYLLWRAWPAVAHDVRRLWFAYSPFRASVAKVRALTARDNSTF